MKQFIYNFLAVCTALSVAAACSNSIEPADPTSPEVKTDELVISATVLTRTVMNDNLTVDWCNGDAISAFSVNKGSGVNYKLKSNNSVQQHATKFEGAIDQGTTEVVALYPYNSATTYSEGVISTEIPTDQTATVSSFGNGAAVTIAKALKGESRDVTMTFHHLCSVLEFTLPENIKNVTSIMVESIDSEVKMTGAISVNCETEDIVSAQLPYVNLAGTITGINDYCVTVAPGNYDKGFKFTITTSNGKTFIREAATDGGLETVKGELYKLGVLSYVPEEGFASVTANIEHTYDNMAITGSNATLTLTSSVPSDFSGTITKWTLKNVKFSQDGIDFRSQNSIDVASGTASAPITVVNSKPYMPSSVGTVKGQYDWTADIYYTVSTVGKDGQTTTTERKLKTVTGTVQSNAPDNTKFAIDYDLAGHTSLSFAQGRDGKTKDISAANACDGSTVYAVGTGNTYKSGLSEAVYTQCSSLISYGETKYDGTSDFTPGDQVDQTWDKHTIACTVKFDEVSSTAKTKDVYVTGIPYTLTHPANVGKHPWRPDKSTDPILDPPSYEWNENYIRIYNHKLVRDPYALSCTFYTPFDIKVHVTSYVTGHCGSWHTFKITVHGYEDGDTEVWSKSSVKGDYELSPDFDMTMNANKRIFQMTYGATGKGAEQYIHSFNLIYR